MSVFARVSCLFQLAEKFDAIETQLSLKNQGLCLCDFLIYHRILQQINLGGCKAEDT